LNFAYRGFVRAILTALALFVSFPVFAAPPELKYVVIITRHGVRSPTWDATRLNQYSATPWPDWEVPPGYLTPHGYALIKLMGAYYRDWFVSQHLLSPDGCQSAAQIYIWADTDERTLETGRAFAESLLPGCAIRVHSQPAGQKDPLFSGVGTLNPELALKAVGQRIPADSKVSANLRSALDTLRFILTGGQTAPKVLAPFPAEFAASIHGESVQLNGPLDLASSLSEDFQLEYTDGMSGATLAWGRLTEENLFQISALHTFYANLTRRTPYLARRRASNLLAHVLLSLEQAAGGKPIAGALGQPGDSLLILCGHDTNLSNISGMLGLSWKLKSYQPDDTPPGGALVFSLWRDRASGRYSVKAQFIAQTLEQMHDAVPLDPASPPASQILSVPGCSSSDSTGVCPWPLFKAALQRAIDPAFVSQLANQANR
jgi:4-phytase / acid phosphatase